MNCQGTGSGYEDVIFWSNVHLTFGVRILADTPL